MSAVDNKCHDGFVRVGEDGVGRCGACKGSHRSSVGSTGALAYTALLEPPGSTTVVSQYESTSRKSWRCSIYRTGFR